MSASIVKADPQKGQITSMSSIKFISVASVPIYTRLFGLQTAPLRSSDRNTLRVTPKIFERIKLALGPLEEVDNHIAVIEDDPLASRIAIFGKRGAPEPISDLFAHGAGNGLELRLRVCRAKNEVIREGGDAAQVEDDNVESFFVCGRGGAGLA